MRSIRGKSVHADVRRGETETSRWPSRNRRVPKPAPIALIRHISCGRRCGAARGCGRASSSVSRSSRGFGLSSFGFHRGRDRWSTIALLHNPGHVTIHHARIENDCAACHVTEHGQFISQVRDDACTACHDAAIHHENQTSLIAQFVPRPATQPTADAAMPMDNHPQGLTSADCVHCHVEHRGEKALLGTDNSVCPGMSRESRGT